MLLIDILACPQCRQVLVEKDQHFNCLPCQLSFPIDNGIPVMLMEEAMSLSEVNQGEL